MNTNVRCGNDVSLIWLLTRSAYYRVFLPCALFFAAITLFVLFGTSVKHKVYTTDYFLLAMLWMFIILPLSFRYISIKVRDKRLHKISSLLKSDLRFSPQANHEIFSASKGKYLGIDTKRGTILYVHMLKKGVIDVVGLNMGSWTNVELEGSALRIYIPDPDLPMLSITAPPAVASNLYNTLGAMSHKAYSEPCPDEPWPLHVARQSKFVEFEHKVVVPQAVA